MSVRLGPDLDGEHVGADAERDVLPVHAQLPEGRADAHPRALVRRLYRGGALLLQKGKGRRAIWDLLI